MFSASTKSRRKLLSLFAALFLAACRRDPLPRFPRLVLWAWESPQDLRFIDPQTTGVAFLARTLLMKNGALEIVPRRQPLRTAPETPLMAVVRIQSQGAPAPVESVCAAAAQSAHLTGVQAFQIDFDASRSERTFYRNLLACLEPKLPPSMPLTITALASWCEYDDWMTNLPIADAVPMLFRMGVETARPGSDFRVGLCKNSLGISMDERVGSLPRGRRLYIFHPGPWTPKDYRAAVEEFHRRS